MKKLVKSFGFAFRGIFLCLKNERNMRIHFCAAFYVIALMRFFEPTAGECAAIFIVIGLVISAEAFNTAIEAAVDLVTDKQHKLAGLAKDAAAGAVLITAVSAGGAAFAVFGDVKKIKYTVHWFADRPAALILLIISVIAWTAFIFAPCGNDKKKNK